MPLASSDPSLTDIDPMLDFIQSFNPGASSSSSATNPEDDEGDDNDDDLEASTFRPLDIVAGRPNPHITLQAFGRMIKGRKDFSEQTEAEFDAFCSLMSPDDRAVMIFTAILETRDLVLANKKADKWVVSEELKESTRIYSRAFILSPTTVAYRGDAPKYIMAAMRDLKVEDLPPVKEVARLKVLRKLIVKFLTDCRNNVKEKIKNSLATDSPTRNVADLTHAVISNTPVQPTLQLYMRMAFLRWCYVKYAHTVSDDAWWLKVDESIDDLRTNFKDELRISQAFNSLYQKDKDEYGDPADSDYQVIEPKDIVSWQSTINTQAAQVQGKNKKRKRSD